MSEFGGFGQQSFFGSGSSTSWGGFGQQPYNSFSLNPFSSNGGSGQSSFPPFGSSYSAPNEDIGRRLFRTDTISNPSPDLQLPIKNWHLEDAKESVRNINRNWNDSDLRPRIGGTWDMEKGFRTKAGIEYRGFKLSRDNENLCVSLFGFVLGLSAAAADSFRKEYNKANKRREMIKKRRSDADWPDGIHIAVAGAAGTGKSSLVNALRGMRNGRPGATPVGTTETTGEVHRYLRNGCDSVWIHDVPGAGTASVKAGGYFRSYELGLYDCVLVVYSDRLLAIDLGIIKACNEIDLPACLVRSKSDQVIRNIVDDAVDDQGSNYATAKQHHITTTLNDVRQAYKEVELPETLMSSVFIVNKNGLYSIVTAGGVHKYDIHEKKLLEKLGSLSSRSS